MENASKALIMAGAVLIAILIISLGIMVFNNFGDKAEKAANMDQQDIAAFNSKITPYVGQNVSGTQVNALIQYVISVNIAAVNSEDATRSIKITFPGNDSGIQVTDSGGTATVSYGTNVKRVETGSSKYYKVNVEYGDNGLINKITITE